MYLWFLGSFGSKWMGSRPKIAFRAFSMTNPNLLCGSMSWDRRNHNFSKFAVQAEVLMNTIPNRTKSFKKLFSPTVIMPFIVDGWNKQKNWKIPERLKTWENVDPIPVRFSEEKMPAVEEDKLLVRFHVTVWVDLSVHVHVTESPNEIFKLRLVPLVRFHKRLRWSVEQKDKKIFDERNRSDTFCGDWQKSHTLAAISAILQMFVLDHGREAKKAKLQKVRLQFAKFGSTF